MKKMISFYKFLTIFISCFLCFAGFCDDNLEAGSEGDLSAKIATANTNGDPSNIITLTASFDNQTLTLRPLNSLDTFLFIDKNLTIAGNNKTISTPSPSNSYRRGFFVGGKNAAASNTITIQDLTINGAQAKGGDSDFGGAGAGLGGALFVGENTNVTVKNVKFIDCQVKGGNTNSGGGEDGGGGLGGNGGLKSTGTGGGGGFIFNGGDAIHTLASGGGGGPGSVGQNANSETGLIGGDGGNNLGGVIGAAGGAQGQNGQNSINGGGGSGVGDFGSTGGNGDYGGGGGGGTIGNAGHGGFGGGGGSGNIGGAGGFGGGGGWGNTTGGNGDFGGGGSGSSGTPGIGGFGGGNGAGSNGGAGGAMGGAIFIQTGGELTIEDYVEFSLSNYTAGVGGVNNGSALGRDIFMMSGGSLTFDLIQNSTVQYAIDSDQNAGGGSGGSVTKNGPASVTLNGANTYTGTTIINNGDFILNGSIITPVIINGGYFKGNATVANNQDVTNQGGILSPGDSIGTINITGNYSQLPGSTLEIEIDQTGASDLVVVTGNINIAGTLNIFPLSLPQFFQDGDEFIFMTFGGTRTGTFFPIFDPEPHLEFEVKYDPNQIVIILKQSILLLPTFSNPNAEAVAEYILGCNFTNPDFNNVLSALTGTDITEDALLQISPVRFGALKFTNCQNDQTVSKILTDHLRKLYRCKNVCNEIDDIACVKPNSFEVWGEPFAYFTHQSVSEGLDLRPFKNKVFGGVLGGDYNFSNHINLGAAVGYSYADIDWKGNLGKADINSVYGALYASRYDNKRFINASIVGTGNFYDVKRKIRFGVIDRVAKHNHKGFDITAHLGTGLNSLIRNNYYFQPTIDVDYTYDYQESFKEKGADSLNLIVDSTNFSNIRAVWLLNFIKDLKYRCICLSPAVRVGYVYEDELLSGRIKSRLDADSICSTNKFSVKTYHKGHSKGIVGANITGIRYNGFTFYLNYQFEIGKSFHQHLGAARFEWNF